MQDKQFDIPFDADANSLAERLKSGRFTCILELDSPRSDQPFESALAINLALARAARHHDSINAIAITDRLKTEDSRDAVETAIALMDATQKPMLLHVSGKGTNRDRVVKILATARNAGIRSILAVSGDRSDKHPPSRLGRVPPHPVGYFDSVKTIQIARNDSSRPFLVGCAVNPFKYNPADQYLQYYKMMRKLLAGADYVAVQAGWDMRKHQEVKWFLQMREMEVPAVARLMLLNRDKVSRIHEGLIPGAPVSRSFAAQLQRESDISDAQCLAAQLRRLSLQVLGCRLLGFSGVQIAGIDNEQTMNMVLNAIQNPPESVNSYADWVAAWNEFHGETVFTPLRGSHYMFQNLLSPETCAYDPETCKVNEQDFPRSLVRDRLRHRLLTLMQKFQTTEKIAHRLRLPWCHECGLHEKHENAYCMNLCPNTCPKRLVHGACGGSAPDGTCEFGHNTCFFHRPLALANDLKHLDRLECIDKSAPQDF